VISSDATPKEIQACWSGAVPLRVGGLLADIQPPDLETKMAILDKKAEAEGVKLPDDVRSFMAAKTKSNVRELEGALIKLIAYSSLTGTSMSFADGAAGAEAPGTCARPQSDDRLYPEGGRGAVPGEAVQLKEKSNTKKVVYPGSSMYLVKELTDASLPENRPGLRREASHHCDPFRKQDREGTSYRPGIGTGYSTA